MTAGDAANDHSAPDLGPTLYNLIDGLVRFLGINQYSPHNTTQPRLLVDLMPEVYSRSSDALLRRLLSRKGFTTEQRRSLLRRVRDRGSVYLAPINAVYVRQFRMTSCRRGRHSLPASSLSRVAESFERQGSRSARAPQARQAAVDRDDAFYATVFEHALAFFGSRILYPARPALRDADIADLFDVTREDLEHQTSLPFADAVEVLDFLILHRANDLRAAESLTPLPPSPATSTNMSPSNSDISPATISTTPTSKAA